MKFLITCIVMFIGISAYAADDIQSSGAPVVLAAADLLQCSTDWDWRDGGACGIGKVVGQRCHLFGKDPGRCVYMGTRNGFKACKCVESGE